MLRAEETEAARREICTTPLPYEAGEQILAEERLALLLMPSLAGWTNIVMNVSQSCNETLGSLSIYNFGHH